MTSSNGNLFLVSLRNPYDRHEGAESGIFTDDGRHRPLIGTPTQDRTMGAGASLSCTPGRVSGDGDRAGSGGRGDENEGGEFRMPPPR